MTNQEIIGSLKNFINLNTQKSQLIQQFIESEDMFKFIENNEFQIVKENESFNKAIMYALLYKSSQTILLCQSFEQNTAFIEIVNKLYQLEKDNELFYMVLSRYYNALDKNMKQILSQYVEQLAQKDQFNFIQTRIFINFFLDSCQLKLIAQKYSQIIDAIKTSLQYNHSDANQVYSLFLLSYQLSYHKELFTEQQWNTLVQQILEVLGEYQMNTKIFPLGSKIMTNVFDICEKLLCSSSVLDFIKFEAECEQTKKLVELIESKIAFLSSYENYMNELQQTQLRNSPLHENTKFWTQNAKKIRFDKKIILENLIRIGKSNVQKLFDNNQINVQMQQSLLVVFNDIKKISNIVDRESEIGSIDEEVMKFLAVCIEIEDAVVQKSAIQAMSKWVKMDE